MDENRLGHIHDGRARDRESCVANVRRQLETLAKDDAIMSKVYSKELIVVGAFYEISSGIVDFFDEISDVSLNDGSGVSGMQSLTSSSKYVSSIELNQRR